MNRVLAALEVDLALVARTLALTTVAASPASGATPRTCNGSTALCARTLDKVVLATTHNAMSSAALGWLIPNQQSGIPEQLKAGIHGFLLDTHYGYAQPDGKVAVLPRAQWLAMIRERKSAKALGLARDDAILLFDQSGGPGTAYDTLYVDLDGDRDFDGDVTAYKEEPTDQPADRNRDGTFHNVRIQHATMADTPMTVTVIFKQFRKQADGLMTYGPTRRVLGDQIGSRLMQVLYLELIPGLEPLVAHEYGPATMAIPHAAMAAVLAEVTAATPATPGLPSGCLLYTSPSPRDS